MLANPEYLSNLIEDELSNLSDSRLLNQLRSSLLCPAPLLLLRCYGDSTQQYQSRLIFEHASSATQIVHCTYGYGPKFPWGLMTSTDAIQSIGPDSNWFDSFLEAYLNCFAPTHLDIWRVFKTANDRAAFPVSDEASWKDTWVQVMEMRKLNPEFRFDCNCDAAVELNI